MKEEISFRKISFNSIDMITMLIIAKNKNRASVSKIRKDLDIAPTNLTKHLKKLEKMKIIKIKDFGIGRKKEISLNYDSEKSTCLIRGVLDYFLIDMQDDDVDIFQKEKKEIIKRNKSFKHDLKINTPK